MGNIYYNVMNGSVQIAGTYPAPFPQAPLDCTTAQVAAAIHTVMATSGARQPA